MRHTPERHRDPVWSKLALAGLRGEYSIAELCRREGIASVSFVNSWMIF
jgi:hypothetical protein